MFIGHNEFNGFEELNAGGDSGVDLTTLDSTHIPMARHSANTTPSPLTISSTPKVEPEKIRKWREEQKIMLQKKGSSFERFASKRHFFIGRHSIEMSC